MHVHENAAATSNDLEEMPASGVRLTTTGGLAPWQMRRVRMHIEDRISSTLRMTDLAELSQLSASYFSRAFKASFGEPFTYYVVRRRLDLAREMMRSSTDTLSHISMACGFADQAHFSRLFRRAIGMTPNQWRRILRDSKDLALVA